MLEIVCIAAILKDEQIKEFVHDKEMWLWFQMALNYTLFYFIFIFREKKM